MAGKPSAGRAKLERAIRAGLSNEDAARKAGMSVSSAEGVRRALRRAGEPHPSPRPPGFQPGNEAWRLRGRRA